jgi:predicted ATPase
MLAHFANSGVQIIIETHSDHVLSGIRLSIKDRIIPDTDVFVHYFSGKSEDESQASVISITIDKNGSIDSWPEGFFDQSEQDLLILSGW